MSFQILEKKSQRQGSGKGSGAVVSSPSMECTGLGSLVSACPHTGAGSSGSMVRNECLRVLDFDIGSGTYSDT